MQTANPTAHKQASRFFELLYDNAEPDHLIAVSAFNGNGKNVTEFGSPSEGNKAATWAITQSDRNHNVYARLSTLAEKPVKGRGTDKDTATVPGVWLDVDVGKDGHPPDIRTAYELVPDCVPLQPTLIVFSGRGLHFYWLFEKPLSASEGKPLLKRWGQYVSAEFEKRGYKLDSVWDLARIMRVPGTVNQKPNVKKTCFILGDFGSRYSKDELESHLASDLTQPGSVVGSAQPATDQDKKPTSDNQQAQAPKCTGTIIPIDFSQIVEPKPRASTETRRQTREAINQLGPKFFDDYGLWVKVGMALHSVDTNLLSDWEEWSKQSEKFQPGVCSHKWESFSIDDREEVDVVTIASLILWAEEEKLENESNRSPVPSRDDVLSTIPQSMSGQPELADGGFFDDMTNYRDIAKRPIRYLFQRVVRLGIIVGLAGESGVGKSWFLILLALAASLGKTLLSDFIPVRQFRVVVLLGEDDAEEISRRMCAIQAHHNIDNDSIERAIAEGRLKFRCVRPFHVLSKRKPTEAFKQLFAETRDADFIIVDPLSKHSGIEQENSNTEMSLLMDTLTSLCRRGEATVLVSHHVSQASYTNRAHNHKSAPRGGTAFVDELRQCWLMYKDGDEDSGSNQCVMLETIKDNYLPMSEPIVLVRSSAGVLCEEKVETQNKAASALVEFIKMKGPVAQRGFKRGDVSATDAMSFIENRTGRKPGKQERERVLASLLEAGGARIESRIHPVSGHERDVIVAVEK